jgi:hypothetical protein
MGIKQNDREPVQAPGLRVGLGGWWHLEAPGAHRTGVLRHATQGWQRAPAQPTLLTLQHVGRVWQVGLRCRPSRVRRGGMHRVSRHRPLPARARGAPAAGQRRRGRGAPPGSPGRSGPAAGARGAGRAPVVVVQRRRRALLQLLREALQEAAPARRGPQRRHEVRLHARAPAPAVLKNMRVYG